MTLGKEFSLELKKLRHRHIPALFAAVFVIISAWMAWSFKDMDPARVSDPSALAYMNLLVMNTLLCPITAAVLASRMCDMEQQGNTYKWLCTIQKPEHVYRGKVLAGSAFLALFCLMQTVLFQLMAAPYESKGFLRLAVISLSLFPALYLTAAGIFILQLNLSLKFTNQLTPIFINIGGTFAGLFSWFLPQIPLRFLIPWGYYAALCHAGYIYDKETRYTAYYWDPFPVIWLAVLIAGIAFLYHRGKTHFLKTVQETM